MTKLFVQLYKTIGRTTERKNCVMW